MLPDNQALREAFEHLEVLEDESATCDGDIIIAPKRDRQTHEGQKITDRGVLILRQTTESISVNSLAVRVADALCAAHHTHVAKTNPLRIMIAAAVIAMAALKRPSGTSVLDAVNDAMKLLQPMRVHIWAIMPYPYTGDANYSFGDFTYGQVNLRRLRECCERAGSDFFDLWGELLRNRLGLQRSQGEIITLNHIKFTADGRYSKRDNDNLYRIIDEYYAAIAEEERRHFMVELDRQQAIYCVAGLGSIPSNTLLRLGRLAHWVVVLTRQDRGQGWVIPEQQFIKVLFTKPIAYSVGFNDIRSHLRINDWGARPLDNIVQRFCEYYFRAQILEDDGMLEETLLHMIFGLDLLLGGEAQESLTVVLSERTAILTHMALGNSIASIMKFVRTSYDMRSGYAHRGQRGELDVPYEGLRLSERLKELKRIYRAVLATACFARIQPWSQDVDARSSWVKRVDILRAKYNAGLDLSPNDIQDLGIDQVRLLMDGLPSVLLEWGN